MPVVLQHVWKLLRERQGKKWEDPVGEKDTGGCENSFGGLSSDGSHLRTPNAAGCFHQLARCLGFLRAAEAMEGGLLCVSAGGSFVVVACKVCDPPHMKPETRSEVNTTHPGAAGWAAQNGRGKAGVRE